MTTEIDTRTRGQEHAADLHTAQAEMIEMVAMGIRDLLVDTEGMSVTIVDHTPVVTLI
jgi:hypothetical protein